MLKRTILTSQTPFHYYSFEDGYYPTRETETALKSLIRCVKRREGTSVILGATGTGKSLLCTLLSESLSSDLSVVTINNTNDCTPKSLYQSILFELERPYLGMDENEMRLELLDILTDPSRFPAGMALIIDEAHNLSQETLEELRLMTNGRSRKKCALSVVLCGNLRLEENLSHPRLESFQQRISTRICLDPWTKKQVSDYITARLKAFVEKVPPKSVSRIKKFSVEAGSAVHTASGGVQRLVVQLCDQAYLSAVEAKIPCVDADLIQSVWAQIQQLPDPCSEMPKSSPSTSSDSCIEFGSLDDDSPSGFDDLNSGFDPDKADSDNADSNKADSDCAESDSALKSVQSGVDDNLQPSKDSGISENSEAETESDEDPFKINFDALDKAQASISELVDAPEQSEQDRQPTPIPSSDLPIENAINRANNIIGQIDQIEAYFTSYCTVDYVESPLADTSQPLDNPPAPQEPTFRSVSDSESLKNRPETGQTIVLSRPFGYLDPFDESFQQEETVRLDEAHPVPASPYSTHRGGMVKSAVQEEKKGVY